MTAAKIGEAFRIWNSRKDVLVKRELPGGPPKSSPLPSSAEELRARHAAREAAKRAKRPPPPRAKRGVISTRKPVT
jgi:hypothetical protein